MGLPRFVEREFRDDAANAAAIALVLAVEASVRARNAVPAASVAAWGEATLAFRRDSHWREYR